jgi:hypothetical protein
MACMCRASRDRERVAAASASQCSCGCSREAHAGDEAHARPDPFGPAASLMRLQRGLGNRGVQRLMRGTLLERKSASPVSQLQTQSHAARLGVEEAAASRAHEVERQSGKEMALPAKATTELAEEMKQRRPRPRNGSASIQCDGSGGYEITYGIYENATCGTKTCVTKHESSHIKDWKGKWPNGCKNQAKGYVPTGVEPDDPLITDEEYTAFLKQSECTAHTIDLDCANGLPQPDECKQTVKGYIKLTSDQKKHWC